MHNRPRPELIGVQSLPLGNDHSHVVLSTSSGDIKGVFHRAEGPKGVVWVSGALGGLDGPSFGIFANLSRKLLTEGISSLRLDYRFPGDFEQCVLDVLVGVDFLLQRGVERVACVGHSFGAAVVIMSGVMSPAVKAVVGLSSQTFGAHRVNELSPKPLLLIHGKRDRNLPVACSQRIYEWAKEPKELVIYDGSGHFLRECCRELNELLKSWLVDKLGRD